MKRLAFIIFFNAIALMLLGLVIVMSASSTYSVFKFESVFHLFNSHLFKVGLGILFMILFCFVPYELYKGFSKWALIAVAVVLVITLIFAPNIKGATRSLDLGIVSLQPAHIAQLLLIIHLAFLLEDKANLIDNLRHGFMYPFIWVILISGLIMIQPNISNGILLIMISLIIMYVGGARLKHIFVSLFSVITASGIAALIYPHSRGRIFSFVSSLQNGGDINLQVKQALYSLGSGGITGVGVGNSMQNNLFLPEAYGDFIFAILGEELGFIGAVLVLVSFFALFIAGIMVAKKTKDRFGQILAFGITLSVITYAFVNIAVTTGLLPTTGLPLPFISYGGTSLLFLCISIGILINIALSNEAINRSDDVLVRNEFPMEQVEI
jgi:cell division protein FtsW